MATTNDEKKQYVKEYMYVHWRQLKSASNLIRSRSENCALSSERTDGSTQMRSEQQ